MRRVIDSEPELLTPDEVMQIFQISRSTLYNWTKTGRLTGYKAGNKLVRYRRKEILGMLRVQNHPVEKEQVSTIDTGATLRMDPIPEDHVQPKVAEYPKPPVRRVSYLGVWKHLDGVSSDNIREDRREEIEREERNIKDKIEYAAGKEKL